jgi:hypothetical protein
MDGDVPMDSNQEGSGTTSPLQGLPLEVQKLIWPHMDAQQRALLRCTNSYFRGPDGPPTTAIDILIRLHPGKQWRNAHTLYRWCMMAYPAPMGSLPSSPGELSEHEVDLEPEHEDAPQGTDDPEHDQASPMLHEPQQGPGRWEPAPLKATDPELQARFPTPESCLADVDAWIPAYLRDKLPAAKIQVMYTIRTGRYHNLNKNWAFTRYYTPELMAFLLRDQDLWTPQQRLAVSYFIAENAVYFAYFHGVGPEGHPLPVCSEVHARSTDRAQQDCQNVRASRYAGCFYMKEEPEIPLDELDAWRDLQAVQRLNKVTLQDVRQHGSLDRAVWSAMLRGADVRALEGAELPYSEAKSVTYHGRRLVEYPATSLHLQTLEGHFVPHLLLRPNRLLAMSEPEEEIPALVGKLVEHGVDLNAYATCSFAVDGIGHYYRRQPINMIMDACDAGDYPCKELQRVHLILLRALVEHGAFDSDFVLNPDGTRRDAVDRDPRLRKSLERAGMWDELDFLDFAL